MINIITKYGSTNKALEIKNAHLHLYDKTERENRKLGHITITSDSLEELQSSIKNLNEYLP